MNRILASAVLSLFCVSGSGALAQDVEDRGQQFKLLVEGSKIELKFDIQQAIDWLRGTRNEQLCEILQAVNAIRTAEITKVDSTIKRLERRIEALEIEVDQKVPAFGDSEETKAIVAFFSEPGERVCPKGWSGFKKAHNRFILGADLDKLAVGKDGGEREVTLTRLQMPVHSHGDKSADTDGRDLYYHQPGSKTTVNVNSNSGNGVGIRPSHFHQILKDGGGQAHNNMPPYIALYFCQKE